MRRLPTRPPCKSAADISLVHSRRSPSLALPLFPAHLPVLLSQRGRVHGDGPEVPLVRPPVPAAHDVHLLPPVERRVARVVVQRHLLARLHHLGVREQHVADLAPLNSLHEVLRALRGGWGVTAVGGLHVGVKGASRGCMGGPPPAPPASGASAQARRPAYGTPLVPLVRLLEVGTGGPGYCAPNAVRHRQHSRPNARLTCAIFFFSSLRRCRSSSAAWAARRRSSSCAPASTQQVNTGNTLATGTWHISVRCAVQVTCAGKCCKRPNRAPSSPTNHVPTGSHR